MPISSPPNPRRAPAHKRLCATACLLLALLGTASAQTLAHPGWVGNGLNVDPWWQHAVFYEVTTEPDFKDIATRLNALRSLGVDALLLPAPTLKPQSAAAEPDPTLDDFDELIHQSSRQNMRILLTIPTSSVTSDVSGTAHFWLNHGVAGFHVATSPGTTVQDVQTITQLLRKLTAGAAGQRIVITDFDLNAPATAPISQPTHSSTRRTGTSQHPTDTAGAQLQIDSRPGHAAPPDTPTLRPLLAQTLTQPNLLLAFPSSDPATPLAKVIATILLTTHAAALIDANENLFLEPNAAPIDTPPPPPPPPPPPTPVVPEGTFVPYVPPPPRPVAPPPLPPPPSVALTLTDWYQQLGTLHHGNAAFKSGNITMLDFDLQNALVWVARPATISTLTPPIVVACNLSSTPAQLSIGAALKTLNLHGTYLRTLLRSDKAMGPQDLNNVILPPYSIYIGELRR